MMQDAIERFLWEELGYRKIGESLEGKRYGTTTMRDFLEGTLFATFRPFAFREGSGGKIRVRMPGIPKIHAMVEEDSQVSLDPWSIKHEPELHELVLNLPYFTRAMNFFHEYSPDDMKIYLQGLSRRLFQNSEVFFTEKGEFRGRILDEDFYFGLMGPPHIRTFDTYFRVEPCIVEDINRIQARYYAILEHGREGVDWGHRQDYTNDVPETDLSVMIGKVPANELLELSRGLQRLEYTPASSYTAGQIVDHKRFGIGIIQCSQSNQITVYFLESGESKTLVQNYRG